MACDQWSQVAIYFALNEQTQSLLVPLANYVLIRRFSAKEEPRRLIAAPFLASQYNYPGVGLENHLNYIYKKRGHLDIDEAFGLSAFLGSALMDRYFRIVNGNTQVNAAELRALPLPPLELIKQIGSAVMEMGEIKIASDLDTIVFTILRESGYLAPDFPIIRETRITMGKIQEAQEVLKALGLPPSQQNEISALTLEEWPQAVQSFIETRGTLLEIYQKRREQHKVPLRLANGEEYHLSSGPHNELQVAIVEEFDPRFAPGARLLYLGDTENKTLILDPAGFKDLGVPIPSHDKLPDVVFYDATRNRLFLIEAVTSHGSVSPKRHFELEEIFKECSADCIYVGAFLDFVTFKNFLTEISGGTEVWLAEIPDHLIHFNGDRFLAPHR